MLKRYIYQFACWVTALTLTVACNDVEEAFQELAPKIEEAPEKEPRKEDVSKKTRAYNNEVTLAIETPGTLKELLGDSLKTADKLVLSGKLDGNDMTVILRDMSALLSLDLTQTTFVENGLKYSSLDGGSHTLEENVIGNGMFYNQDKLHEIKLPAGTIEIGVEAFNLCDRLQNVVIPDGVKSIGYYAFCRCENLTNINLPTQLQTIGPHAFRNCEKLDSISFPEGLRTIGEEAFAGTALKTLDNLPDSLQIIDERAFSYCHHLKSVTLPKMNGIIDYYLFLGCI